MRRIIHILPHPGGGAEMVIDLVSEIEGYDHEKVYLSATRRAWRAGPSIGVGLYRLRREAAGAALVHAIGDVVAMISLSTLRSRPSVFGTHGLHFLRRAAGTRGALAERRLRAVVTAADRTVCSSATERAELAAVCGEEAAGKLVEVPNGIRLAPVSGESERREARQALGLEDSEVVALYLGELEPRKHPLAAVAAAERARADGVPLVLLVAGSGPEERAVRERSGPAVRALGFRDDAERLLAAADMFVMPSEREGLSLAVLEAMGHGLATVVSDGAGNPEAVDDAGLVIPLGDSAALAEALTRLAGDPQLRERLGRAGRERVERLFSAERFLDDMRAVFEQVAAQGA
jgi:glycosyltransferase involved in cell wall biosynthesis